MAFKRGVDLCLIYLLMKKKKCLKMALIALYRIMSIITVNIVISKRYFYMEDVKSVKIINKNKKEALKAPFLCLNTDW